jgi:glutamate formiminotransferase/formiminotetrahydrofolate cyclodeaminase
VAGLAKTRGNSDQERAALSEARAALASVRDRLLTLADADTEAYNKVLAALRLPKATDADKATRKRAIQEGTRAATEAPLDILRTVVEAGAHARRVAQYGNPAAASDVRVAVELLEATAAGAAANVEINLTGLEDEAFRKAAASSMIELSNTLTEHTASARAALLPS